MFSSISRLVECFSVWRIEPRGDLSEGDIVITQAASATADGPGPMNELIAQVALEIARKYGIPIAAQGEVADLLVFVNDVDVYSSPTQREQKTLGLRHLDSRDMALWHKGVCDALGCKRPILVTYQPHLVRVLWVTEKCAFSNIIVPFVPSATGKHYAKGAEYWWASFQYIASFREFCGRMLFWMCSWI